MGRVTVRLRLHNGMLCKAIGKALGKDSKAKKKTFYFSADDPDAASRQHAYRLCAFAAVVEAVSPIGSPPQRESHVRPIAGLSDDQKREVWRRFSICSGSVQLSHSACVIDRILPKVPPSLADPAPRADHVGDDLDLDLERHLPGLLDLASGWRSAFDVVD